MRPGASYGTAMNKTKEKVDGMYVNSGNVLLSLLKLRIVCLFVV